MDKGGGKSKEIQEEIGVAVKNSGKEGGRCTDIRTILQVGGLSHIDLWLGEVGGDPSHCQDAGDLPPHDRPLTDREETLETNLWEMWVPPTLPHPGGGDEGHEPGKGGGVNCANAEHGVSIHCDTSNPRPVNGYEAETGVMGVQNVVGASRDQPCGSMEAAIGEER